MNPNLYADGKVCLSLLGTWDGPGWRPNESSLSEVLLAIQGQILCSDPFFNEPGFEAYRTRKEGAELCAVHNAKVAAATVLTAMIGPLANPPLGFADYVRDYFSLRKPHILRLLDRWERAPLPAFRTTQGVGAGLDDGETFASVRAGLHARLRTLLAALR